MAEFFRRSPELLQFQDALVISLYELDLEIPGPCVNLCRSEVRASVNLTLERLTSSEHDESIRYRECRDLASDAVASDLVGLAYPSAAATWSTRNLVLLGQQHEHRWRCHKHEETTRPKLEAHEVTPLPR